MEVEVDADAVDPNGDDPNSDVVEPEACADEDAPAAKYFPDSSYVNHD